MMIQTKVYGKGFAETLERPGHPGEVVGVGPFGNVWIRSEIYSCTSDRYREGYSVSFQNGGTGWYPNGNVRNVVWSE